MFRHGSFGPLVFCVVGAIAFAAAANHRPTEASAHEADEASRRLTAFEALRRSASDFAELPTWDRLSGPDPYLLAALPGSKGSVGILRGEDALVLLDARLGEESRIAAPSAPVALAVADDGSIYVAGELSPKVARFRVVEGALVPSGAFEVPGVRAIRGLAAGLDGWLYLVEEHRGHLVGVKPPLGATDGSVAPRFDQPVGNGPIRVERVGDRLVVDCVLDHALVVQKLEPSGMPTAEAPIRIVHDGPIWSFAARSSPEGMWLALGGVEDHPLDRTIGAFGYIDSFLYVYGLDFEQRTARRELALNLSELGVVTPKALAWASDASDIVVAGYGSDRLARIPWTPEAGAGPPRVDAFVPGANAALELGPGRIAFANPLLDAWVLAENGRAPLVISHESSSERTDLLPLVRLGEALFFTTAMAPWNHSEGPLSRFTCETCHYEGYVDGRTHHTGRGTVHAVTKPLLGLFNNRPHFSRALDEDLATVAFNEFRVANARSGHDPWFELSVDEMPWLRSLGFGGQTLSPELLRRGLMTFLMSFSHRPNPMALGRDHFRPSEQRGAAVFRDRCESCHEARLLSDAPESRAPFDQWEALIFSRQGPIVWGKAQYEKTGVTPYVHELGARVPSLRRLYKKHPYFTNGSAPALDDVLQRARFGPAGFWHESADETSTGARLSAEERADVLEFLDLL